MGATMSGSFKGIDQSSGQSADATAASAGGAEVRQMSPYNTMSGYSGLNEDF